jgi:hypothetical protein
MRIQDQENYRQEYYNEALRYMQNAEEELKSAKKEGKYYQDDKYVKTACGTAYNGVLKALDGLFLLRGFKKPKNRRSIEFYRDHLAKFDKKMLNELNTAYNVLHLDGYYDGITSVKIIQGGFDVAYDIIERIKPASA